MNLVNQIHAITMMVVGLASQVAASDWVGYLGGPYRTACVEEKGLLQSWPDDGPPLLWATNGLGGGYSEVLVVGDAVFSVGSIQKVVSLQCRERLTGKIRWQAAVPGNGASTPAWLDDRLYLSNGSIISCYDAKTGANIWQIDLRKVLQENGVTVDRVPQADYSDGKVQSLLVHKGLVVYVPGQLQAVAVALDSQTGKLKWISKGNQRAVGQSWSSASVLRHGSREVILAPCTFDLVAINPDDGKVLWEERCIPPDNRTCGATTGSWGCPPVFSDGLLHVFAGYVSPIWSTYRLSVDASKIEHAWDRPRLSPRQENVVLVDGVMYGSGVVYWGDMEINPDFKYEGKPLADLEANVVANWRKYNLKKPIGSLLVAQDLKTGGLLGAIPIAGLGAHGGALITTADHHLYVVGSSGGGQPDAIRLIEATPQLRVKGKLVLPFAEMMKKENLNGADTGWGGLYTRPQVAHGCLWMRVHDQLRVYDLRKSP